MHTHTKYRHMYHTRNVTHKHTESHKMHTERYKVINQSNRGHTHLSNGRENDGTAILGAITQVAMEQHCWNKDAEIE
jgi:hypothetical protein